MARPILLGIAIGGFFLLVLDAAVVRLGLATGMVPKLDGSVLWVISRAAGVTAYLALTLNVILGLFVSTGTAFFLPRARTVEVHRWLSAVALTMVAAHALALLGDGFARFDVLDIVIPFLSSYRAFAVGLGVAAAYAVALVHASFFWRRSIGPKTWRKLHRLTFFAFVAMLLHGLLAGSDTGTLGMQALYISSGTAVAGLVLYRVLRSTRRPARARRAADAP